MTRINSICDLIFCTLQKSAIREILHSVNKRINPSHAIIAVIISQVEVTIVEVVKVEVSCACRQNYILLHTGEVLLAQF